MSQALSTRSNRSNRSAGAPLGALALCLLGAACSAPEVRPQLLVDYLELGGDVGTRTGPVSTTNSAESLGLDQSEALLVPRVALDWDPIHVTIEGLDAEYSGTGVAEATLDIGNTPITVGEPVDSAVDVTLLQARAVWDFLPDPLLDLGLGLGVGWVDYGIRVESLTGPGLVAGQNDLPFLFLAGRAAKRIGRFEILFLAGGGAIQIDDEEYKFADLEALLTWGFWDVGPALVELVVGYRYIVYEYDFEAGTNGAFDVDVSLRGPVVGLSVLL